MCDSSNLDRSPSPPARRTRSCGGERPAGQDASGGSDGELCTRDEIATIVEVGRSLRIEPKGVRGEMTVWEVVGIAGSPGLAPRVPVVGTGFTVRFTSMAPEVSEYLGGAIH